MLSCFAAKNAKFAKAGGVVSHRVTEAQRRFVAGALPQTPKAIKSHAIDWRSGYGAEPHLQITLKKALCLCASV